MHPKFVNPAALVPPVGPYSHLSRRDGLVHLAGQTGIDAEGNAVEGGIAGQAEQAMQNIRLALESQGLGLANIVKLTTYVAGAGQLPGIIAYMDKAFGRLFPGGFPPNTLLAVQQLVVPELLVEIEAIAHE